MKKILLAFLLVSCLSCASKQDRAVKAAEQLVDFCAAYCVEHHGPTAKPAACIINAEGISCVCVKVESLDGGPEEQR